MLERAISDLRRGRFVLLHDSSDREDETDMVIGAEKVRPNHIVSMRRDAGGLICVALHSKVAKNFNIPYMMDIYKSASSAYEILNSAKADDLPYDERSAFSISVNHRNTFTGVTDEDRALTISELGKLSARAIDENCVDGFGENFRTPGHVPLLRAADNLLEERVGHTELSVALMEMSGISPAAVICEMLDSETSRSLSKEKAKKFSEERGLVYLSGRDVQRVYSTWKGKGG